MGRMPFRARPTVNGGTATLAGTLTSLGNALNISSGALNINTSNASVASLTQSGGLFNGSGTLTVTGASTFSAGRESGSGTTNAQGGAAFSSTGFALDGGHTLQLGGASTASGTNVQINLNGANPNTGLSDAGSGILTIGNGATFNDQTTSSGLNIVRQLIGSGDTGTTAAVNNAGTFTKSGSAATSTICTPFNNTGTVDVESGTLNLSRRRDGCWGDLQRGWHSQLQRWHADAGQQFQHHAETRPSAAVRRRSMEALALAC